MTDALQAYSWPGNVRELENIIERAVILTHGSTIELDETLDVLQETELQATSLLTLDEIQLNHILRALKDTQWRIEGQRGAAARLGLKPSTLRSRLQKLGISKPQRAD